MISLIEITRIAKLPKRGVFGVAKIDGEPFSVTLEPPDFDNKSLVSCIPSGQYLCERYSSERYPNTWQIMDVPDREKILFHAGNFVYNTSGCILLAQHYGKLNGDLAILNSGNTFQNFMRLTSKCYKLQLTIRESY